MSGNWPVLHALLLVAIAVQIGYVGTVLVTVARALERVAAALETTERRRRRADRDGEGAW